MRFWTNRDRSKSGEAAEMGKAVEVVVVAMEDTVVGVAVMVGVTVDAMVVGEHVTVRRRFFFSDINVLSCFQSLLLESPGSSGELGSPLGGGGEGCRVRFMALLDMQQQTYIHLEQNRQCWGTMQWH